VTIWSCSEPGPHFAVVLDHDPNLSSPDFVAFHVELARLQSTRVVTRPLLPKVIVYFDLSSGTSGFSSGRSTLTSCHDVPSSSLAPLDCPPAEFVIVEVIAKAANAIINRIEFVLRGRSRRQGQEQEKLIFHWSFVIFHLSFSAFLRPWVSQSRSAENDEMKNEK
jgi:hypothetical protein